jgi:hypothetical protein
VFNAEGRPAIVVAGQRLGVFAGLRLPRAMSVPDEVEAARESDERMER